ncbi:MAG TPA: carboxypeptidase-like regulatory domain-containing protein [Planctomycetota bacterium]|jgi:hypothetical protein|nr:carboxypeptidase-like regulatory domain-containing protein [Planctomycetota bacterium]
MVVEDARRTRSGLLQVVLLVALAGILATLFLEGGPRAARDAPSTDPRLAAGRAAEPSTSVPASTLGPSPKEESREEIGSVPGSVRPGAHLDAVVRGRLLTRDGSPPPADALVSIDTGDPEIDFPEVAKRLGGKRAIAEASFGSGCDVFRAQTAGLLRALSERAAADGTFSIRVPSQLPKFAVEVEADFAFAEPVERHSLNSPDVDPMLTVFVEPGGKLEGAVRGPDGRPVAGALLLCRGESDRSARSVAGRTDAAGAFSLRGLLPGRYCVVAFREGFASAIRREIEVSARETIRADFGLGAPSSVTGRVVDRAGEGVAAARVRAYPILDFAGAPSLAFSPYGCALADREGFFRVESLGAGGHRVSAEAPGFGSPGSLQLQVPAGGTIDGVELVLDAGRALAGKVMDREGSPLPDASVTAELDLSAFARRTGERRMLASRQSVRTSADGSFRMGGFGDGPFVVEASHPEHGSIRIEGVEPGREDLEIRLPGRSGIAGTVRDAESGAPVQVFSVDVAEVEPWRAMDGRRPVRMPSRAFDSPEGTFELLDIPPSPIVLSVTASGFVEERIPEMEVKPGEVRLDVEVRLRRENFVEGTVLEAGTGTPVSGAEVYWWAAREGPTIDVPHGKGFSCPDGSFLFHGVPPGNVKLQSLHRDFRPATLESIEVRAGEGTKGITLSMFRGGTIEGVAVAPDGFSYAGADVRASGASGLKETKVESQGFFRIAGLRPGKYTVSVGPSRGSALRVNEYGERTLRAIAVVEEGKVTTVQFAESVRGPCTVRGRLRRGEKVVAGAGVSLVPDFVSRSEEARLVHGGRWWTRSSADGSFEIPHAPSGEATLEISSYSRYAVPVRVPDSPELVLDLRIPAGRIEGRVLRASDLSPLPGASLGVSAGGSRGERVGWATTTREGRYEVPDLLPGKYAVAVDFPAERSPEHADLAPEERHAVEVVDGEATPVDFLLRAGGTARVLVRDPDGRPLAGVPVVLADPGSGEAPTSASMMGKTGGDGVALLKGVPPGKYAVRASHSAHAAPTSEERVVREGEEVEFQVDLRRGRALYIACAGADGSRVDQPEIRLFDARGIPIWPSLQEGGGPESKFARTWWFVLCPGEYSVEAKGKGYRDRVDSLRVDPEGPREVTVRLEREDSPK